MHRLGCEAGANAKALSLSTASDVLQSNGMSFSYPGIHVLGYLMPEQMPSISSADLDQAYAACRCHVMTPLGGVALACNTSRAHLTSATGSQMQVGMQSVHEKHLQSQPWHAFQIQL